MSQPKLKAGTENRQVMSCRHSSAGQKHLPHQREDLSLGLRNSPPGKPELIACTCNPSASMMRCKAGAREPPEAGAQPAWTTQHWPARDCLTKPEGEDQQPRLSCDPYRQALSHRPTFTNIPTRITCYIYFFCCPSFYYGPHGSY